MTRTLAVIPPVYIVLLQVERIVDKRKNKKGKWEYLIRWKGYGSKEDTWEPEHHLLHCEEFIDQFNNLRLHDRRSKPAKASTHAKVRDASRYQGETRKKKRTSGGGAPGPGVPHRPRKMSGGKASGDRLSKPVTYKRVNAGLQFVPPIRRPTNGLQNGETDAMHYRTAARTQSIPSSRVERMMGEMEMGGAKAPLRDELGKAAFGRKKKKKKKSLPVFTTRDFITIFIRVSENTLEMELAFQIFIPHTHDSSVKLRRFLI